MIRRFACVLMAAFCTVFLIACDTNAQGPASILPNHKYFLIGVTPSAFTDSNGDMVSLQVNDHSYMTFDENFRTMQLVFHLHPTTPIWFIVISISLDDNHINATVERIYRGNLIRYHVTSSNTHIYFRSAVAHTLTVTTPGNNEFLYVESDMTVLTFARVRPSHIAEGF